MRVPREAGSFLPAAALGGWALLAYLSHHSPPTLLWLFLGILSLQWLLLAVGMRSDAGRLRRWILWGLAFRCLGFLAVPVLDDDYHRFLWDGRQLVVSGNPYATPPAAHFDDPELPEIFREVLDQVNYPDVPSVYGPLCQAGFGLAYLVAPGQLWPWKLLLLLADAALVLLLLKGFGNSEGRVKAAYFAAWCPLSVFETGFNAHPDALGVTLLVAAVVAWRSHPTRLTGVFLGLAICAKVFALLMLPYLLWRSRHAWWTTALVVILCYAPFWMQGSLADLAGLKAFGAGWEFNSSVYALLARITEPDVAKALAMVLLGIGQCGIFLFWWKRHSDTSSKPPPGLAVYALFFLLVPTFNPWYALWLLPFAALRYRIAGGVILAAVSLSYITYQNLGAGLLGGFGHPPWVRPVEFAFILGALVGVAWRERMHLRRDKGVH